jgi:hypothetical protein
MNLLAAANYDPVGGAVTKATTSLIAMTAFDTSNLRLAFTVPAHGMVHVRMSCVHHGATTIAQLFLGCLEGTTLRGRAAPSPMILGTAIAAALVKLEVSFTITGLTPGAVNWDAAYGVETVANAGGIKYGGANNTSGNDAFGGFNFEIWDPRPIPTATPGATGGLFIAGTNAATTITTGLTTTFTGNLTGSVGSVTGAVGSVTARVTANTDQLAGQTVTAGAGVTFPSSVASPTNITAGTITTATNVTTVNGLAANVITAASMAADASAEIADAVWDEDATGHQTQGTFGQAIGDPLLTTSILSRIPAALSGDGFMKADMLSINDDLTSGTNATLNLKKLNIVNNSGSAIYAESQSFGHGLHAKGNNSPTGGNGMRIEGENGMYIQGSAASGHAIQLYAPDGPSGLDIVADVGVGIQITSDDNAILAESFSNDAIFLLADTVGKKSIKAAQDIQVSDGDLTLAAITDAVWDEATAGHTTAGTTGKALTDAGSAGDPWGTTLPGAYAAGTAGKIIGDNINATISSRATQTSVDDLPTNAELATALGTADDAVLAQVALVKAKTDQLTFGVTNTINANITHVIADAVQENGADNTEWGGTP